MILEGRKIIFYLLFYICRFFNSLISFLSLLFQSRKELSALVSKYVVNHISDGLF